VNTFISIIIPCYNEEKYISECLQSIVNQNYPSDLIEVIVIDGSSTDGSVSIINNYVNTLNKLIIINNPKNITPISMNIGIKESSGDCIVILSAHSYLSYDFLQISIEKLEESDAVCVGGPIINKGRTFIGKAIALATKSKFGVGSSLFRVSNRKRYVDTVAFGLYRKEIFSKIGYFDETLVKNQDYEFNQRIIQYGEKILLIPEIQSFYYNRNSLPELFKQYFFYGFWKVSVVKKNTDFFKLRYQIPFIFIVTIIILAIGGIYFHYCWIALKWLLLLYSSVLFWNSMYIGIKNKMKYIPVLAIIYFILHFAFGIGFLSGVLKNIILPNKLNVAL
jgi:glycosyltransferase involved in cell wall biosynthesis